MSTKKEHDTELGISENSVVYIHEANKKAAWFEPIHHEVVRANHHTTALHDPLLSGLSHMDISGQ